MPIGTSLGGFFQTEMEMHVAPFQEKDKGIQPETGLDTNDDNELPGNPGGMKALEVGKKNEMPFPDNIDHSTDFVNRFPKDMKSGILNDIKPQDPDRPLLRKIGDYIGELPFRPEGPPELAIAIGRRGEDGKIIRNKDPAVEMLKRPADEEGYTNPDNPYLWIRKKQPGEGDSSALTS